MKIELGREGKFLSGRSRANEIVQEIERSALQSEVVEVSFDQVESCSQSFISELIVRLKEAGAQKGKVRATGIRDPEIERRFNSELIRLGMN